MTEKKNNRASLYALTDRIKEIADNSRNATHITIMADWVHDEIPSLRYSVSENIAPKEEEEL